MKLKQLSPCVFGVASGLLLWLSCSNPEVSPFEKPYEINYHSTEKVFKVGTPAKLDTPVVLGNKPMTFRIAPMLPLGLVFDTSTAVISGTPLDTISRTQFSVTAINSAGNMSVPIFLTVLPAAPANLTYSVDTAAYTVNVPIAGNNPSWSGGNPTNFGINPKLPAGLQLDAIKGTIYGTPTAISSQTPYVVIASNAGGTTQTTVYLSVAVLDTTVGPPLGLSAKRIDSTHVKLMWNSVTGADSYILSRSLNTGVPGYQQIKTVLDTFYLDSVRYDDYYFVQARKHGGTSTAYDTVFVKDTIGAAPVVHVPVITSSQKYHAIKVNQTDTIRITVADSGQTVTVHVLKLDSLKALFTDTNAIRWIPRSDTSMIIFSPGAKPGTYVFNFMASDGKDSVLGSVSEYVGNVDHPPQWHSHQIAVTVNDGAVYSFVLRDSCKDPDSGDVIKFRLAGDTTKSTITNDSIYTFTAGMLDTVVHVAKIIATDTSLLSDTVTLTITIAPVYYSFSTIAQNGTVTVSPNLTSFRMGQSVSLTAVAATSYVFTGWTGTAISSSNPMTLAVNQNEKITANFQTAVTLNCTPLSPGASINSEIKLLSAAVGASQICPAVGLYDNNTIEVQGAVTVQIKAPY